MRKFTYDVFHQITPPTLILSTKYHKHLGTIQNVGDNIANDFNMASHQEISFDVYKTMDGEECGLWDQIVDFKYVFVPEHNEYYEISVSIDDADNTIKHVVGVSAGEVELSQRYLRDFHCNDETDINFTPIYKVDNGVVKKVNENGVVDFEYDTDDSEKLPDQDELIKATVLYRPVYSTDSDYLKMKKKRASLLYRVLKDKCPDWSVGHIDSTLANIQRTFTADGSTIYDFLTNTVATELGCLFTFDSVNRKINVYDLKSTCEDCGFRGEFIDKCPKCGSQNFIRGYGAWKNVYVSPENTALQITVDGDSDSVKNCFKIVAGDDLMTATVRNINPNNSSYIYRFSDDMKADMPSELLDKLEAYETYYNSKVADYEDVTLTWYNALDKQIYYQTTMMPKTPIPNDTTAKEQLDIIMNTTPLNVAVEKISSLIDTTANNAVEGYIRVLIDPRYKVEVSEGTLSANHHTWQGYITVTSLGGVNDEGEEDTATSTTKKTVHFNEDYENFLEQKVQKSLDRTDASFMTIYDIEDDNDFKDALKLYSIDSLVSFSNSYQSILEVLIQQGLTKEYKELYGAQLYDELYKPYYDRKQMITDEIKNGEAQTFVKYWKKIAHNADGRRQRIQAKLNLEKFLGEDLYKIFVLYLREDTYTNSNYISDGLDSAEIINKAMDLLAVAQSELIKASELQFTLTGQLNNFLNTEEFADFKDEFEIGDYIICKADDKIYRLRITNVNYAYNDPENISITFSNVVRGGNFMSDVASVLSKASSMATSYNYVAHQANQGKDANNVVSQFKNTGLDSKLYNILAGTNQDVTIDSHGITAREYDDVANDYKNEQLIVTSHCLAFTDDGWANVSLSLGRHTYTYWDEANQQMVTTTGYGLNSQFVESGNIHGSQIIAGHIYSEDFDGVNGAHFDLNDGKFTFADGKLKFDGTKLYVQGDVMTGSIIDHATITDSTINVNSNFIVTQDGNVTLNGTVGGTAWQSKQDKLTVNPTGTAADTIHKLKIDNVIYDFDGGSSVIPNPSGTATDILRKIEVDGDIYSLEGTGNANYDELLREDYEALPISDKDNNTIYFVKDEFDVEFDGTPTYVGEVYQINNEFLNPNWSGLAKWTIEPRFFFNDSDCRYCYENYGQYGYDTNALMHPYYNHGTQDVRNIYITEDAPVDTHYCIVFGCYYGLNCITVLWIPKDIIDNRQACVCLQHIYSTVPFEMKMYQVWNTWDDPSTYPQISTISCNAGFTSYGYTSQYVGHEYLWFCNCPLICGYGVIHDHWEDNILAYLETGNDNYPELFQGNYFLYKDQMMLPYKIGTVYLNSVDYTGRIEVVANPDDVATANLAKIKIDGIVYEIPNNTTATDISYDNTDSGLTATNVQDAIDEISVLEGLVNVDITSPTDGQTLVYDSQNQEWVNASGGGGTTVIPNPVGTPTDTLSTIRIGNDIYDIEGSGGGGDGGYSSTLLWDYVTDNSGTIPYGTYTVTLRDAIENYDILIGEIKSDASDSGVWDNTSQMFIDVNTLINGNNPNRYLFTSYDNRSSGWYISGTTMQKVAEGGGGSCNGLIHVYGLKFGGTAVTETTLWTGTIDSVGDTGVLDKPLGDYDYLLMYGDVSNKVGEHHIDCLDARMLKESLDNGDEPYFSYEYYDTQYLRCRFSDETHFSCVEFYNCDFHYRKIVGIKINDASGGGTNVEANPADTPTDTLNTIRIGDTVYDIAGSGGGTVKSLVYELTAGAQWETFTVTDPTETLIVEAKNAGQIFDWEIYPSALPDRSGGTDVYRTLGVLPNTNTNINVAMGNNGGTVYISANASFDTSVASVKVYKEISGGGSGITSEIIPISAGDGTTSRTFTFNKTPKSIQFYWDDPVLEGTGWIGNGSFIWGQEYLTFPAHTRQVSVTGMMGGCGTLSYGADGKSVTINAPNAFQASNTPNGSGLMFVDYGGGSGTSQKDIADMSWTQIISQAGGAWSTATAIPSSATHVAVVVDYDNKAYMPQTFKLSDWDKYADTLNHSLVEWGFDWKVGSSYDTIQIEYDSTNRTMRTYAGYSGVTLKTYALS